MNRTYPLVSVGIPTFNRPEGLRRSLDCISSQTYPNLEIIVSDNASPSDETKRVVGECIAKDARIKYFRQPSNQGPAANFQYLLDAASGEYFLWMSDDDWRAPSYIEALLHQLQTDEKAVLSFCDIGVLDEQGSRRKDFYNSYLPYLQRLVSDDRLVRMTKFFLQDESYGKANLAYGLFRTSAIKGMSIDSMFARFGLYGLDNLIVFILLGKGRLKLVGETLYYCTAGNVKYYVYAESAEIMPRLPAVYSQLKYLLAYPALSTGAVKFLIAALFPIKFVLFYGHIFSRKLMAS